MGRLWSDLGPIKIIIWICFVLSSSAVIFSMVCNFLMLFSSSLVLSWCFSPFLLFPFGVFSPFLLYSLYILLFRWSVGVCVLLQPWLQPPKKRILIMRESPPHRISTTPLFNSEEKGKGEGGGTTIWRRIHSGNNLFHSNQHWIWSTVVFESYFRRNMFIQSTSIRGGRCLLFLNDAMF